MSTNGLKTGTAEDQLADGLGVTESDFANLKSVEQGLEGLKGKVESLEQKIEKLPDGSAIPAELDQLKTSVTAIEGILGNTEKANWSGALKAINDRLEELATQMEPAGTETPQELKTFAEAFLDTINAAEFKHHLQQAPDLGGMKLKALSGINAGPRITGIPSLTFGERLKTVTTTDVGAVRQPTYRPGIVSDPELPRGLVGRIPRVVAQGASSWVVPYETDDGIASYIQTEASAAVAGGTVAVSSIPVYSTAGFTVGSIARIITSGGTYEEVVTGIDEANSELDFGTDEIDFDIAKDDKVVSTFFGSTGELQTKPNSGAQLDLRTWLFQTMALIMPMSQQVINTVSGIEAWAQNKLRMRTMRNYSQHLLYGDPSTGNQLQGFSTYANAQTFVWSTDGVAGDNRADAIVRAADLITWPGPQTVVLSRGDITNMNLEKTTTEAYVHSTLFGRLPLMNLNGSWFLGPWELYEDDAVTPGDFFLVNFGAASEMVDQGTTSMTAGMIDDDFARNIIRWRYEEVVLHAILSTKAYVVGEWDSAPA